MDTIKKIILVIVSSITHDDINSDNEGAILLKNFLKFAENASVNGGDSNSIKDRITEEVKNILDEMAIEYNCQVGNSFDMDIAVKNNNKYSLGIFIDFFNYHNENSVLDNLLIQQNILKKFGWNTCVINPLDLIYNYDNVAEYIRTKAIEA
jgi:hypothetical protein